MFSPASAFLFPRFSVLSSYSFFVPVRLAITFEEIFSTQGESDTKKSVQCYSGSNLMMLLSGKDQRGLALALCRLAEDCCRNDAMNISKDRGCSQLSVKC